MLHQILHGGHVHVILAVILCEAHYFEGGFNHHYVYKADSDYLGMQNITTTVKFHVHVVNGSKTETVSALYIDSIIQYAAGGLFADNPLKWDLEKRFLFRMSSDGVITLVHYHPEDPEETVLLKKVLASTLSARIKISKEPRWKYESTETDHLGELNHDYSGKHLPDGVQLDRYHRSLERVERIHKKTMHYDTKGTIHRVNAEDNIILENRIHDDLETKRTPLPGEYVIPHTSEGDIGKIHAKAKVSLKLTSKIMKADSLTTHPDDYILQVDDLVYKKTVNKTDFGDIDADLKTTLNCIHKYEDKSDSNRTVCVNKFREKLMGLKESQYIDYADSILRRRCKANETLCKDERYLFIDIVSRAGDEQSQSLILQHVFQTGRQDTEELRRSLLHFSTLKAPVKDVIQAVDKLCFGNNNTNHGVKNISRTEQRACLTLGALARTISRKNMTEAEHLMEKIETWMQKQDIEYHRTKRESFAIRDNIISNEHLISNVVLLHALGNAGLERSVDHILNYTEPNTRESAWRRAAIGATRHYTCHKSASALLRSMYHDKLDSVRKVALRQYMQHPKRFNITREEENVVLSKNYTYPVVMRAKREGILESIDTILFEILIEPIPEYHWGRTVGSAKVGASFGVDFLNRLHIRLKPFSGFLHLNVHDKVYAEAHIGIINYKVDILLIELCYRGRLEYNLNLLKDFTYGIARDLKEAYDSIANEVVSPMSNAAKGMQDVIKPHSTSEGIFTPLSRVIEPIPDHVDEFIEALIDLTATLDKLSGLSWVTNVKQIVSQFKSFAEDMKHDSVEFYNLVSSAAITGLPAIEKDLVDAINLVIESVKKIAPFPRQGFATVDRAKTSMNDAMGKLIHGVNTLMKGLSTQGGQLPTWLNPSEIHMFKQILPVLSQHIHSLTPMYLDEMELPEETVENLSNSIMMVNHSVLNLDSVRRNFMTVYQNSLNQFKELKKKTSRVKSTVMRVFGPKFHKNFHAQRRICDDKCGCGNWPTTTKNRYPNMPGIDVIVMKDETVISPLNGLVFRRLNRTNEIRIHPSDDNFKDYDIIISNVQPVAEITLEGVFIEAGDPLATGIGKQGCRDPFIHVAMRKMINKTSDPDSEYNCIYVDPSVFVDNIQLVPKWHQDCKEFTFRHINNILDAGLVGKGFVYLLKEFGKRAVEWAKTEALDEITGLFPESSIMGKIGKFAHLFKDTFNSAHDLAKSLKSDNYEAGSMGMFHRYTDFASGVGNIMSDVSHGLADIGFPGEVTDVLLKIEAGSRDFAGTMNNLGDTVDNIVNTLSNKVEGVSGIADAISSVVSGAGGLVGDVSHLLADVGVSKEVTNIMDKVKFASSGVSNIISDIGHAANDIANNFKDSKSFPGVMKGLSSISSGIGNVAGDFSNMLKGLGVSTKVTGVFDQIKSGAEGVSSVVGTVGDVAKDLESFIKKPKNFGNVINGLTNIASGIGKTAGDLSHFLKDVGVPGDVTKFFVKLEDGAKDISDIMGTVGSIGNGLQGITRGNDFSGIMSSLSNITKGVGGAAGQISNMLKRFGVSTQVTDILTKMEAGTSVISDTIGHIGSIGKQIASDVGKSGSSQSIMKGLSGISSAFATGVGDVSTMLKRLGVKGESVDILQKIKVGAGDAAGIFKNIDSSFSKVSNQSTLDGLSIFVSAIGNTTGDIGHLLSDVGVSNDVTDILSKIELGAGDASSFISDLSFLGDETSSPESLQNTMSTISSYSSVLGNAVGDITSLLAVTGVSDKTVNILSKVQSGLEGTSILVKDIGSVPNYFTNSGNISNSHVSNFVSEIGNTAQDINHLLTGIGVTGEAINVLSKIQSGTTDAAQVLSHLESSLGNIGNPLLHKPNALDVIDGFGTLSSSLGTATDDVGHFLQDLGVSGEAIRVLDKIHKGADAASTIAQDINNVGRDIADHVSGSNDLTSVLKEVSNIASEVGSNTGHIGHLLHDIGISKQTSDILNTVAKTTKEATKTISKLVSLPESIKPINGNNSITIDGLNGFAADIGSAALHLTNFLKDIGVSKKVTDSLGKFQTGLTDVSAIIDNLKKSGNLFAYLNQSANYTQTVGGFLNIAVDAGNIAGNLTNILKGAGLSNDVTNALSKFQEVQGGISATVESLGSLGKTMSAKLSSALNFSQVLDGVTSITSTLAVNAKTLTSLLGNAGVQADVSHFLMQFQSSAVETAALMKNLTQTGSQFSHIQNLSGILNTLSGVASSIGKSTGNINTILNGIGVPVEVTKSFSSIEKGVFDTSNMFRNFSRTGRLLKALSSIKNDDVNFSKLLFTVNANINLPSLLSSLGASSQGVIDAFKEIVGRGENVSNIIRNLGSYGESVLKFLASMKGSNEIKSNLLIAFGKGNLTNVLLKVKEAENHIKQEGTENSPWRTINSAQNIASKLFHDIDVGSLSVAEWIDSLQNSTPFTSGLKDIQEVIENYINSTQTPSLHQLLSMSVQNMGEFLQTFGITSDGDKNRIKSLLHLLPGRVCNEFNSAIEKLPVCLPDDDCHGLRCIVPITYSVNNGKISLFIRFIPENSSLEIVLNNTRFITDPKGDEQLFPTSIKIYPAYALTMKVLSVSRDFGRKLELSLALSVCAENEATCLPEIGVLDKLTFHTMTRMKRSLKSKLAKKFGSKIGKSVLKKMPFRKLASRAAGKNIKTKGLTKVSSRLRKGFKDKLTMKYPKKGKNFAKEFIKVKDSCDVGDDPEKFVDITIFELSYTFGVGPIGIKFAFGAGGAIGMSIDVDIKSMSGTSKVVLAPWVSGEIHGSVSVNLLIASGGLKLIGYILKTKFPVTTESNQAKKPVSVTMRIDLEIIPIELQLRAWAKALFVTFYDGCLWKWSAPSVKFPILKKQTLGSDNLPPRFVGSNSCDRKRRVAQNGCSVYQVPRRHPIDTAFQLEVFAEDDTSDVKQFYSIGDYRGGQNIVGWTEFRGSTALVPISLPNGIPLYFTVKARNSQALESVTQCILSTYDNTVPDGRVEASYSFSSHPNTISASLIVIDDTPLTSDHVKALGYSPGAYGREVVSWDKLDLLTSSERQSITSDLRFFSEPRDGRLTARGMKVIKTSSDVSCAKECITYGSKCVSFDYEYHTETCELHEMIEGPFAKLRISGTFHNYERLNVGYNSFIEYHDIALEHGAMYYINTIITNTLGYRSVLSSRGTMVDFTPPEPGYIGKPLIDTIKADKCKAAVTQTCKDVTWKPNHRMIIDGTGARTVFNGHKPAEETLYTLANHYISANFDGFHDRESGVRGYTWAAGKTLCKDDIVNFTDPHAHLSSPKYWTYTGYAKDIHLQDGSYYVTVQALNNIVHGGALVTTVCHSTPLIVDTTPPVFHQVTDIMFDEDFDILAVYYNVSDELSKIARVDFGLGKTKHDVDIRGYDRHDHMTLIDPYFVVENLDLKPGVPAWIRVRAVNNVDLFASGHGNEPIMIDKTPPLVGVVFDGETLEKDIQYQHETDRICGQWKNFFDPESGIKIFTWGIGTEPLKDNIVRFRNISHHTKNACSSAKLQHNNTYFSTVIAFNDALNSKSSNGSSDGVLVDTTEPEVGYVNDGLSYTADVEYSSESATIEAVWNNFIDPESGIADYTLEVFVNTELKKSFPVGTNKKFVDHTLSLEHLDRVKVNLHATNGAGLEVEVPSNGFLVDHTPPFVLYLIDSKSNTGYQSDDDIIDLKWEFDDPESGIKEYRYFIQEFIGGQKQKSWPLLKSYETIFLNNTGRIQTVKLTGLLLKNGAKYMAQVTAINKAMLSSSYESMGVTVDTTPPLITKVHIGHLEEDEDLDDNGDILHDNPESITVSWIARDSESGISAFYIAIGTIRGHDDIYTWSENRWDNTNSILLKNLELAPTSQSPVKYFVSIKMRNKAGLFSGKMTSGSIVILKANVPGIVFDGREVLEDSDYQYDKTSLGMSFIGFKSEACNIVGYEWSIGSQPYYSDILPFTDYGLVMENDSFGHAQIHLDFYETEIYYVTVRARTGHQCRKEFIVASSNGIKVDTRPPKVEFVFSGKPINGDGKFIAYYQNSTDVINIKWNTTDSSGIHHSWVSVGLIPLGHNLYNTTITKMDRFLPGELNLHSGDTVFVNVGSRDRSGLEIVVSSPSVTFDISPPTVEHFSCTPSISYRKALVTCSWFTVKEYESVLTLAEMAVSVKKMQFDILNFTSIPLGRRSWSRDFKKVIDRYQNASLIYFTLKLMNTLGLTSMLDFAVTIDKTIPKIGAVYIVTAMGADTKIEERKCQIPKEYIEIVANDIEDAESRVERMEVALGSKPGTTDILSYRQVDMAQKVIFLNHLSLRSGRLVFASVMVFNSASLYNTVTSKPVVISPNPTLRVYDGMGANDDDYQSRISMLAGHWRYSDPCPIISAEWAIEDLTGDKIQNFTKIEGNSNHFYNDELRLTNGFAYINIVRIIDALGRSHIARSDGISVRIQPPIPGHVRDGLDKIDMNYQQSSEEISSNWDNFGKENNRKDPTQHIIRYEVAIGNDRRYEHTRSNVHYFEDVGLNKSHTFNNLNLTAKSVKYYVTVRAYSEAGSYIDSSSNGIRVGYNDGIVPGTIEYNKVQSSTETMDISWGGFDSDYGIRKYEVGIGSKSLENYTSSFDCTLLEKDSIAFDVHIPENVGTDTIVRIEKLKLVHGLTYFVTVIAYDETGVCVAVTGDQVIIDTTPPIMGNLQIGLSADLYSPLIFITDSSMLSVSWDEAYDRESSVTSYKVDLVSQIDCNVNGEETIVDSKITKNETETTFYYLNLLSEKPYFIFLTAVNEADLKTHLRSRPVFIDTTNPSAGIVKTGSNWYNASSTQSSTKELHGAIGVARSENAHLCPQQLDYDISSFHPIGYEFSDECVQIKNENLHIALGHDTSLTKLIKGGVSLKLPRLKEGTYTVIMKAMLGRNVITSFALASNKRSIPTDIHFSDEESFLGNNASFGNDTFSKTETELEKEDRVGVGFFVSGYKEQSQYFGIFWIRDRYQFKTKHMSFNFDPSTHFSRYEITLQRTVVATQTFWKVSFHVNNELMSEIGNIELGAVSQMFIYGHNKDNYYPALLDPFHPFETEAIIKAVMIPRDRDHLCVYGTGFYDGESHIKEIWAAISDSVNKTDNVVNYTLVKEFCLPCSSLCPNLCNASCEKTNEFDFIPISFYNLSLFSASDAESRRNQSTKNNGSKEFDNFDSPAYFINVNVINFAGKSGTARSEAITIDTTPPVFIALNCVDPDNSMDEPVRYQKSTDSVGAFWECEEDVGQISGYRIMVSTSNHFNGTVSEISVGLDTKAKIKGLNGTLVSGQTYFITVIAKNTAGLTASRTCNITVDTKIPQTRESSPVSLFSKKIPEAPSRIGVVESGHQIGIKWQAGKSDIEYYEWQIGSSKGGSDIFPRVRIGSKDSTSVAIVDGKMWLDGRDTNSTLAQYILRNWTDEEIERAKHNTFFNIEPGRCMYISLLAISRSHVSNEIPVDPICFKRKTDLITSFENRTSMIIIMDGGHFTISSSRDGKSEQMAINITGTEGGILAGLLHNHDLTSDYGTAASGQFKSFIANPQTTMTLTSRLLRKRLMKYNGLSFYLSPAGKTKLQDWIDIELKFNNTDITPDVIPALLYWDTDGEIWKHTEEECVRDVNIDYNKLIYHAKVCLPKVDMREKRQTYEGYQIKHPRQFSLMIIRKSIINEPPVIITKLIPLDEDNYISYQLKWNDKDGDHVTFKMAKYPVNGFANISKDGIIYYNPNSNFFGVDNVVVTVSEVLSPYISTTPNHVNFSVDIMVANKNDAPGMYFWTPQNITYNTKDYNKIVMKLEANTSTYHIGTFIGFDIDSNDTLQHETFISDTVGISFNLTEISDIPTQVELDSNVTKSKVFKVYDLTIYLAPTAHCEIDYGFLFHDQLKYYSKPVWLKIYVLENPCVHGKCEVDTNNNISCDDISRSKTFKYHRCSCGAGYEGNWCEREIDECRVAPCPLMYDCHDELADFTCVINIAKLMAILVCVGMASGLVAFIVYKKCQQNKQKMKVHDLWKPPADTERRNLPGTSQYPTQPDSKREKVAEDDDHNEKPIQQDGPKKIIHPDPQLDISFLKDFQHITSKLPPHHHRYRLNASKPPTKDSTCGLPAVSTENLLTEILKLQNKEITPIDV